jgi:hypothetical protein
VAFRFQLADRSPPCPPHALPMFPHEGFQGLRTNRAAAGNFLPNPFPLPCLNFLTQSAPCRGVSWEMHSTAPVAHHQVCKYRPLLRCLVHPHKSRYVSAAPSQWALHRHLLHVRHDRANRVPRLASSGQRVGQRSAHPHERETGAGQSRCTVTLAAWQAKKKHHPPLPTTPTIPRSPASPTTPRTPGRVQGPRQAVSTETKYVNPRPSQS